MVLLFLRSYQYVVGRKVSRDLSSKDYTIPIRPALSKEFSTIFAKKSLRRFSRACMILVSERISLLEDGEVGNLSNQRPQRDEKNLCERDRVSWIET